MNVSDAVKDAWLLGTLNVIDAKGPARLVILSDGKVVSDHTLSHPCATLINHELRFAPIEEAEARFDGTASQAKIYDGERRWVLDLEVGTEVAVEQGQTVKVVSGKLRA